jgi:phosphatidylinositol glycan class P protein
MYPEMYPEDSPHEQSIAPTMRRKASSVDAFARRTSDRRFSEFMEGVAIPPSMSFLETQRIHAMQMEIYGFSGWIASIVIFGNTRRRSILRVMSVICISDTNRIVCYLLWAYLPDEMLKEYGITYYPSRYWALALPAMLCMTVLVIMIMYVAINLLSTAPLDSYNAIRGIQHDVSHSRRLAPPPSEDDILPSPISMSIYIDYIDMCS